MSMPTKVVKLLEQTGVANTAFTTAAIDVSDFDSIHIHLAMAGGAGAGLITIYRHLDADGTTIIGSVPATIVTGAQSADMTVGVGCRGFYNMTAQPTGDGPLLFKGWVEVPAMGVGITATVKVYGRRRFRGPDAHINAD